MSDDHKDSGWRKRQIALDIKAENARGLGLNYEGTSMTQDEIMEMAKQAGIIAVHTEGDGHWYQQFVALEAFAKPVAAKEREACAKVCDHMASRCKDIRAAALESAAENIRARGQA